MRGLLKEVKGLKGTKAAPKVPKVVKGTKAVPKASPKVPKVVKGTKAAPKVPKVPKVVKGTKAAPKASPKASPKVPKVVKGTKAAPKVPKVVKGTKATPKATPKVPKVVKGTKAAPKVSANKLRKTKNGGGKGTNNEYVLPYSPHTHIKASGIPLIITTRRVSPKNPDGSNFKEVIDIAKIEEMKRLLEIEDRREIYKENIREFINRVQEGNMLDVVEREKWYNNLKQVLSNLKDKDNNEDNNEDIRNIERIIKTTENAAKFPKLQLFKEKEEEEDAREAGERKIRRLLPLPKQLIQHQQQLIPLPRQLTPPLRQLYEILNNGFRELDLYLYTGYVYENHTGHIGSDGIIRNPPYDTHYNFGNYNYWGLKPTPVRLQKGSTSYSELFVLERLKILYEIIKLILKINNIEDRNLLSLLNQFNKSIYTFEEDYKNNKRFVQISGSGLLDTVIILFNEEDGVMREFKPMVNLVDILDRLNYIRLIDNKDNYLFDIVLSPELSNFIEKAKKTI